jgi:hypothetical protein
VVLTTSFIEQPAAFKMADMFLNTASVCDFRSAPANSEVCRVV